MPIYIAHRRRKTSNALDTLKKGAYSSSWNSPQNYGTPLVKWDHTVLSATRQRWPPTSILSEQECFQWTSERLVTTYLDFETASTITTSIVHSKLDYCNSLYHNLPNCQLHWLQQIQKSFVRAAVKAPINPHISLPFWNLSIELR